MIDRARLAKVIQTYIDGLDTNEGPDAEDLADVVRAVVGPEVERLTNALHDHSAKHYAETLKRVDVEAERDRLRDCADPLDPCRDCVACLRRDYEHAITRLETSRDQVRVLREGLIDAADALTLYADNMRRSWDAPQHASMAENDANKARALARTEPQP